MAEESLLPYKCKLHKLTRRASDFHADLHDWVARDGVGADLLVDIGGI